jgi:hypothetical protein
MNEERPMSASTVLERTAPLYHKVRSVIPAIEWPVFALGGLFAWWLLIHTSPVTQEERDERRAFEEHQRSLTQAAKRRPEDEDDALRVYNDYLAEQARADESA